MSSPSALNPPPSALPLVSVVIPVYNGQRHLRQALDSVFAQTYPSLEVIAVNDGSTDGSAEILAGYGDRLVVIDQANAGVGAARNAGIAGARGELVAFLDQDDWWQPEKIERQVALFLADEGLGLVHTNVAHYDEATAAFVGPLDPAARPELLVDNCYPRLLLDNQIYNSSVVVRRRVLDQVGPCDLSIRGNTVQDYDLWLRIARVSRFGYLPETLCVFRVHGGQGTWDRRQMLTEEARLLERVLAVDGPAVSAAMRSRMAKLYADLGTAHLDAGQRREARASFARSLCWQASRRATVRWAASWLPLGLIRRLQQARKAPASSLPTRSQAELGNQDRAGSGNQDRAELGNHESSQ